MRDYGPNVPEFVEGKAFKTHIDAIFPCASMSMQKLHVLQNNQLIAIAFYAYGIVTDDIEVENDSSLLKVGVNRSLCNTETLNGANYRWY